MRKKDLYDIIYEDDSIVIVDKPSGLLTIPDRYDKSQVSLSRLLDEKYGGIFIVHRLDKETSGVMVFAKDADSHRKLNEQFQENEAERIYHVILSGIVDRETLDIDIPIAPHPARRGMMIPSARGKPALTKLRVIQTFRHATLAECSLITGRQHQIRVHCAAIGHPLLVDALYGQSDVFLLSQIKRRVNLKKQTTELPIISRVTMHAHSLGFVHPSTNIHVNYDAPYPKDFKALLQVLEKYSSIRLS